jgi:hypothetical protein
VQNAASRCDTTFWRNYVNLKKYRKDNPTDVVVVDGESVLTVDTIAENAMNGYRKSVGEESINYGVKAYMRMGTIEQIALSELDVSFDPDTHKKAMDLRTSNKAQKKMGLVSSLMQMSGLLGGPRG